MRSLLTVIVSFICMQAAHASGHKVAVLSLTPQHIDASTAGLLDAMLSDAIGEATGLAVTSPQDIAHIIGDERLLHCSELACTAEVVAALGVDYVVMGTVGVLNQELVLSLRLYDQRTASIVSFAEETVPNREEAYAGALRRCVDALFSALNADGTPKPKAHPKHAEAPESSQDGDDSGDDSGIQETLSITSYPDHAQVFINGQEIGTAPLLVDRAGYNEDEVLHITCSLDGYESVSQDVRLDPEDPSMELEIRLTAPPRFAVAVGTASWLANGFAPELLVRYYLSSRWVLHLGGGGTHEFWEAVVGGSYEFPLLRFREPLLLAGAYPIALTPGVDVAVGGLINHVYSPGTMAGVFLRPASIRVFWLYADLGVGLLGGPQYGPYVLVRFSAGLQAIF